MKLKCVTHNRRVVSGQHSLLHRNGDGSKCTDQKAIIGGKTVTFLGDYILAFPR